MDEQKINKICWWIPIKKFRNSFKEILYLYSNKEKMMTFLEKNNAEKIYKLVDIMEHSINLVNEINDQELQKKILKENLKQIEIEISSFCNRKCWFCPNSFIDRYSKKIDLSESIFLKIINNLKEIEFDGNISFHRFNEPLADKKLILTRVKQARNILPNTSLSISTNGDYLTREYVDDLANAGINYIWCSYYLKKGEEFSNVNAEKACKEMSKKLGLEYVIDFYDDNSYYANFLHNGLIKFQYKIINFDKLCNNRGGTIDKFVDNIRYNPCYSPFGAMYVDYNGLVLTCCNTRSDIEEHKDHILGDLNKNNIFEIFTNSNYVRMRKELYSYKAKSGACKYCNSYIGYDFLDKFLNKL